MSHSKTKLIFGNTDVTHLLESCEEKFVVNVTTFGDPLPGVYKFLRVFRDGVCVVVGEHDVVENINTIFENIPSSQQLAPIPNGIIFQKTGLEIGGPTECLQGLGVYIAPRKLDNMHLLSKPGPFRLLENGPVLGTTFKGDAVNMQFIKPESYDFVFASHVLEHIVNPLKALEEIWRLLPTGGHCILVLPYKQRTFDHRRPTTLFEELQQHFAENRSEESVMDHVTPELLDVYDFSRDLPAGNRVSFFERCKKNFENRMFHVHVFDFALICQCLEFSGFRPIYFQLCGIHQVVIGQKLKVFELH